MNHILFHTQKFNLRLLFFNFIACKTPHNKQGQCKPLKQCSFLYSLLDNLTNQTATYLRQSLCNVDSDRTNPNVCCPKEAPIFEPPASSVVPKPQTNFCRTPTGQNGTCKPRQECPSLTGDVPRTPKCGNSRVCCPPDSPVSLPPNELLPSKAECGMSTESRIVGGNKTGIDEYTWMVLLQYECKWRRAPTMYSSNSSDYFSQKRDSLVWVWGLPHY